MKKLKSFLKIIIALIAIYFIAMGIHSITVVNKLSEIKTSHFVVAYNGIYKYEAENISESLEKNYNIIRTELKDPEHSIIKVFIHGSQKDFANSTGLRNNANGTSRGPLEFHILWTNWFNSIFPDNPNKTAVHEFTHCVQLNILIKQEINQTEIKDKNAFDAFFEKKFAEQYPKWFWESISIYEAGEINSISVKYAMRNKPDLNYLNHSNHIYLLGYTIIEYITQKWGKDKLPELIKSYGNVEKVLKINQQEFQNGWHKFVEDKY